MSRASVTILAVRIVSLWLIVSGITSATALLFVRIPPQLPDLRTQTALLFGVLPVATGLLVWSLGPPIASRVFRDRDAQGSPGVLDLYRVASVFTGLGLVAWATPSTVSLLVGWLAGFRPGGGIFGASATPLGAFEFRMGVVDIAVRFGLGALLLLKPSIVESVLHMWSSPPATGPADSVGED
jgi:hypothetical protein